MGRCPFGYTAEDEDGEVEDVHEPESDRRMAQGGGAEGAAAAGHGDAAKSSKQNGKSKVPGAGTASGAEKDPASWFYSNQIKSEQEFQAKKAGLRADARKRLDTIMDKKSQRLMWPADSEFDAMSISSGELSELDSDVHSLASVRTCAYSWIEKKRYQMPAETTACWVAAGSLVLALAFMGLAVQAIVAIRPVQSVVKNGGWPGYLFLSALATAGAAGCMLLAFSWRSRKLLLAAHVATLLAYGASVMLMVAVSYLPCEVDTRAHKAMCSGWDEAARSGDASSSGLLACGKVSALQKAVAQSTGHFKALTITQSVACLLMGAAGVWYLFELCYVEKKGVKHMRRHRRNKFAIPWDKIKIVGQPLPCGGGGGGGAQPAKGHGGAGGGKCPVGFGGGK